MKSMYTTLELFAFIPDNSFSHTTVVLDEFVALLSIHALIVLPVAAGPVVNSTLDHPEWI
jgi:hypothetical protein